MLDESGLGRVVSCRSLTASREGARERGIKAGLRGLRGLRWFFGGRCFSLSREEASTRPVLVGVCLGLNETEMVLRRKAAWCEPVYI